MSSRAQNVVEVDRLPHLTGMELGWSDWMTIDQTRIDAFAAATGDFQWIHVSPERAANGPFGTTVAHGYLTLSLLPLMLEDLLEVPDATFAVNYGLDKVRFPSPVPCGSRIRGRSTMTDVETIDSGYRVKITTVVEIEGKEKPGCVAEFVGIYYR